jgi:uncharacterized protein (TIGR02453 family)
MKTSRFTSFRPETLAFLEELSLNNNREWFAANKQRYEELVLDAALEFIQAMQAPLAKIAPHFTAIPKRMGGSLMRVYRDTRFSKNKALTRPTSVSSSATRTHARACAGLLPAYRSRRSIPRSRHVAARTECPGRSTAAY